MEPLQIAKGGTRRVLVIANHPGIVYAFRRVLRQTSGFTLVGYVAGLQVVEHYHTPPRPILLDQHHNHQMKNPSLESKSEILL